MGVDESVDGMELSVDGMLERWADVARALARVNPELFRAKLEAAEVEAAAVIEASRRNND